jgi:hypothetical protein
MHIRKIFCFLFVGGMLLIPSVSRAQTIAVPDLPRLYVDTTMPVQTGQTITVNAGANLQTAINNALPGDTLVLQAGATFTGKITLPAKSNPNNRWVVIRSSNLSSLPAAGIRVSPNDAPNMPKIVTNNTEFAIQAGADSSYYRFIGVEVTDSGAPSQYGATFPDGSQGAYNYGLVDLGSGVSQLSSFANHIIFDRSYIHAQPKTSSRRGFAMNGAHLAVIDSYVSGFKEVGADTQAIGGWSGSGPYKIVNNYLEAAGENVMFGGAPPSVANVIARDVEIRGNHFYKPQTWQIGHPSYLGVPWSVKNLFEIKHVERMLFEGNVLENSWAHAQTGWSMILRSANDGGNCSYCRGSHMTLKNNIIRNVAGGIGVGGDGGTGTGHIYPTHHVLIENNILENVAVSPYFTGENRGIMVAGGVSDTIVRKNTVYPAGSALSAALVIDPALMNIEYSDNISAWGTYGIAKSGGVGESVISTVVTGVLSYFGNVYITSQNSTSQYSTFVTSLSAAEATGKGVNRTLVNQATQYAISGGGTYTPPPPPPAPALSFTASPTSITAGQSATLSWSSTNSTSCSASGGWTGTKATLGNQSVTPTANTTYTLSCTGSGGTTAQSVAVTVTPTPTLPIALPELPRTVPSIPAGLESLTCTVNPADANALQSAINSARGGDVICLTPGVIYASNQFIIPARTSGDTSGWTVIRTNPAVTLPGKGNRITPTSASALAKIVGTGTGGLSILRYQSNSARWLVLGVEITTPQANTLGPTALITLGNESEPSLAAIPSDMAFSHIYIHGWPTQEVRRAISISSKNVTIRDSYCDEVHAIYPVQYDSQCITHWNTPGNVHIENNYLAAGSENIMFAGSPVAIADLMARDVTIRRNYITKPASWKGMGYTVKNLLESKSSQRVLVENNIFDGLWADGQDIALNIKSVNTGNCPNCGTQDWTLRRNLIKNVPGVINFGGWAEAYSTGNFTPPQSRILFEENWVEPINIAPYTSTNARQIMLLADNFDITVRKNVFEGNPTTGLLLDISTKAVTNFDFSDNVVARGQYGLFTSAGSGLAGWNAAVFGAKVYTNNAWVGVNPGITYPAGTTWHSTTAAAQQATGAGVSRTLIDSGVSCVLLGNCSGIVTPPPPSGSAPYVSLFASPTSIASGGSSMLTWSSTNSTSCSASGGWTGTKATSGNQSVTPTANTTYTLSCTGSGGTTTQSVTVTVSSVTPPPPPPPSPTPSPTPPPPSGTFPIGSWIQLTANTNVRSQPTTGATTVLGMEFSGSIGQITGGPVSANGYTWWNVAYTNGLAGWSIGTYMIQTTAPTNPPPASPPPPPPASAPTVSIYASVATVNPGQATTLIWSSTNSTSCSASGGWNGTKATSGSESVTPVTVTTYTLTCTGNGGSISRSVTVNVNSVASPGSSFPQCSDGIDNDSDFWIDMYDRDCSGPTDTSEGGGSTALPPPPPPPSTPVLSFNASPPSISAGQSSALSWSSTNSTGCTASGGWSGTRAVSGSMLVSPTLTTTYTLTCTGLGGSATQSVTVSVTTGGIRPQCSDRMDNDSDFWVDYPYDKNCTDAMDTSELN